MLNFYNVSKIYKKPNNEKFYALKNFSFNFDKTGLYCILGKSGSGKSTIANLGALLDSPSEGKITYNNEDISKYKPKQINYYRSKIVTTVFQHYNLDNDLSVIENIILPRLAMQEDESQARKDGYELLNKLGFEDFFAEKLCKNLSGGEAQRVALLRAIINNPDIIIADEPTGALDDKNSVLIMEMLKKISHKKTVIVITHNIKLAKEFADEIIYLNDGQLENVEVKHKRDLAPLIKIDPPKKLGKHSKWINKFATKRLKKHKGKNILSCVSTVFGLLSIFFILGFSNGAKNVVDTKCSERFDYGVCKISKTETIELENSVLNLSKMTRLSEDEIYKIHHYYDFMLFDINFDALFANNIIKVNQKDISGVSLCFIYKFDHDFCDKNLILQGNFPRDNEVLINEPAEKLMKDKLNLNSVLGRELNLSARYELTTQHENEKVIDNFEYKNNFKIAGSCKEFNFLSVPKIFISYSFIKEYLLTDILTNLSEKSAQEITWYDYIKSASNNDDITSFSHKGFARRDSFNKMEALIKLLDDEKSIDLDSEAILLKDTFISLMHSIKIGLIIFSILAIGGTVLIIGINAFSSYTFERKKSAIYFAFGVSKQQLFMMFIIESILVTFFAFMLSVILSFGLQYLANLIINASFGIENLINIPYMSFYNVPFLLLFVILICSLTACIVFTYLPLSFAKKINLQKELSDE